jgi:hypothetical protein
MLSVLPSSWKPDHLKRQSQYQEIFGRFYFYFTIGLQGSYSQVFCLVFRRQVDLYNEGLPNLALLKNGVVRLQNKK